MNSRDQELVRTTFSKLALMPEVAGALFYERLFAANPNFRSLFSSDMRVQGVKLMTMLTLLSTICIDRAGCCRQSEILASGMLDTASSSPTMTRSRKRSCGRSNRCLAKTARLKSGRRGRSVTTNSPER